MEDEGFDDVEVIYLDEENAAGEQMLEDDDDEPDEAAQMDVVDLSKLTFNRHSKSVFCTDLTKDGKLAASGGEDDCAFIWSVETGNTVFECTGPNDSVTAVCFNHNDKLIATGDMSGMIQVWNVEDHNLLWCNETDDMEWLMWHHSIDVLISGSNSGQIYIWQVAQGNTKMLPSHGSSATCGKLLSDGKHLIVGYEDGKIKLWDIKTATVEWQFLESEKNTITSLEINLDCSLCSVAPSSNLIKIADGKSLGTLRVKDEEDIEVHAFSTDLNFLITGSLKGKISVWDVKTQTIRYQAVLDCGTTILKLGLHQTAFFGCTDGTIYMCDIKTGTLSKVLTGHQANILSITVACDGSFLLSSSDDSTAKIFSIKY